MDIYKRRYYCTNTQHCELAYNDHVYSRNDFESSEQCQCQQPLTEGDAIDRRKTAAATLAAMLLLLTTTTLWLHRQLNPAPLQQIAFVDTNTTIKEDQASVAIPVIRTSGTDTTTTVRYQIINGSAKAGEDFNAADGELFFGVGQSSKKILIPVIADSNYQEKNESFSIRLSNVLGTPTHTVIITDTPLDSDMVEKSTLLVRALSRRAMDIAEAMVKIETITRYLESSTGNSIKYDMFTKRLNDQSYNLRQASEDYIQKIKAVSGLEKAIVLQTMDRWLNQLSNKDLPQQQKATQIMREQYLDYLDSKTATAITLMEWQQQLSLAIPRVATSADKDDRRRTQL